MELGVRSYPTLRELVETVKWRVVADPFVVDSKAIANAAAIHICIARHTMPLDDARRTR